MVEADTTGRVVTTVNSAATGEEYTHLHVQPVKISGDQPEWKRGAQFFSPVSVTLSEKAHTETLAECGYSVQSGDSYTGEQDEGGRGHRCLIVSVDKSRVQNMQRNLTRGEGVDTE